MVNRAGSRIVSYVEGERDGVTARTCAAREEAKVSGDRFSFLVGGGPSRGRCDTKS